MQRSLFVCSLAERNSFAVMWRRKENAFSQVPTDVRFSYILPTVIAGLVFSSHMVELNVFDRFFVSQMI